MHSDACCLSAFFRLGVGEDAVLIQRVNECQCVNTGFGLSAEAVDVYRCEFFSSYKRKVYLFCLKCMGKA